LIVAACLTTGHILLGGPDRSVLLAINGVSPALRSPVDSCLY